MREGVASEKREIGVQKWEESTNIFNMFRKIRFSNRNEVYIKKNFFNNVMVKSTILGDDS